jgi:hypothetical protein
MTNTRNRRNDHAPENAMLLCINGDETAMQHAWLAGLEYASEGLVLALSGNIHQSRTESLRHLVLRWKVRGRIIAHTTASILEVIPASSPRGQSLLGETSRRPWPSLRSGTSGSVLLISDMEIHRDARPWDALRSPQGWRYLHLSDPRVTSPAFHGNSIQPSACLTTRPVG